MFLGHRRKQYQILDRLACVAERSPHPQPPGTRRRQPIRRPSLRDHSTHGGAGWLLGGAVGVRLTWAWTDGVEVPCAGTRSSDLSYRLAVLQAISHDAQSEGFDLRKRFLLSLPVSHHAGKLKNLGQPTPALFSTKLDPHINGQNIRSRAGPRPTRKACCRQSHGSRPRLSLAPHSEGQTRQEVATLVVLGLAMRPKG